MVMLIILLDPGIWARYSSAGRVRVFCFLDPSYPITRAQISCLLDISCLLLQSALVSRTAYFFKDVLLDLLSAHSFGCRANVRLAPRPTLMHPYSQLEL